MRITQSPTFLCDLVRRAASGSLQPPVFQRPYVWTRDDVLALCESVLLGYPIGSCLIWEPGEKAQTSKIGRGRLGPISAPMDAAATGFLLDGQNRIGTLAWMMREGGEPLPANPSPAEAATWCAGEVLALDLAREEIRFVSEEEATRGFFLPSKVLVRSPDTNQLIRRRWGTTWAGRSEDSRNDALRWLDRCVDAFSDARIVVTTLEGASAAEARDAFLHICRVGVPMEQTDFDAALGWPGHD